MVILWGLVIVLEMTSGQFMDLFPCQNAPSDATTIPVPSHSCILMGENATQKPGPAPSPARKTQRTYSIYDKVPKGYAMRPGDCSGNDIWYIHGFVSLAECAQRCNNNPACISFMFYDGRECYPKTKTCATTSKANPKNFFYDEIKIIQDWGRNRFQIEFNFKK